LEFHHINKDEKDFAIGSGNTKSWSDIKKELDKCVLLCANCHREVHSQSYPVRHKLISAAQNFL